MQTKRICLRRPRVEWTVPGMRQVNVLFVVPSLIREGAQTQLVDLVNAIPHDRFTIHLFTFEKEVDQRERLKRHIHFYNQPRRYKYDFTPANTIAKIIDKEHIDVIHCTLQFALLFCMLAGHRARRKPRLIDAIHSTKNQKWKEEVFDQLIYQRLMRRCVKVICVCEAQKEIWARKYPVLKNLMEVIYNGVDPVHFDPEKCNDAGMTLRRNLGIAQRSPVIGSVAAFRREKGHECIVKSFRRVKAAVPDVHLLLAGDGPQRRRIEQQVEGCWLLNGAVHFLGNLKDIRPVYAASDVTVIASRSEAFSMAMLESMAMETPLVATDVGGTREAVVDNETGLLAPAEAPDELTNKLLQLVRNRERVPDMKKRCRQLILEKFTQETMVAKTSQILESVSIAHV